MQYHAFQVARKNKKLRVSLEDFADQEDGLSIDYIENKLYIKKNE